MTVTDSTIAGSGGDGILIDSTSVSSTTDAFNVVDNQLDGDRGSAISITYAGNAAGFVDGNLIGNGSDPRFRLGHR